MGKRDVDIFQLYGKKTYTVKYKGLTLWERIRFCLAILKNRKIEFIATGKVKVINLSKTKILEKMERV